MFKWQVTLTGENGLNEVVEVWAMQAPQAFHRAHMESKIPTDNMVKVEIKKAEDVVLDTMTATQKALYNMILAEVRQAADGDNGFYNPFVRGNILDALDALGITKEQFCEANGYKIEDFDHTPTFLKRLGK